MNGAIIKTNVRHCSFLYAKCSLDTFYLKDRYRRNFHNYKPVATVRGAAFPFILFSLIHTNMTTHPNTQTGKSLFAECLFSVMTLSPLLVMKPGVAGCKHIKQDTQQVAASNDDLLGDGCAHDYWCFTCPSVLCGCHCALQIRMVIMCIYLHALSHVHLSMFLICGCLLIHCALYGFVKCRRVYVCVKYYITANL